jgi:predicted RNase H-related nuclease YkuK (DUF458 family)
MANRRAIPATQTVIRSGGQLTWGQRARQKIDSTRTVQALQQHVFGEREMTQTQINAARILLDRTLPVIKAIEIQQDTGQDAKTITNDQLFAVIEGQAKRIE